MICPALGFQVKKDIDHRCRRFPVPYRGVFFSFDTRGGDPTFERGGDLKRVIQLSSEGAIKKAGHPHLYYLQSGRSDRTI